MANHNNKLNALNILRGVLTLLDSLNEKSLLDFLSDSDGGVPSVPSRLISFGLDSS